VGEPQGDREGWHESEPNATQQRIDEEGAEDRPVAVGDDDDGDAEEL
jgi:hypothetical protein